MLVYKYLSIDKAKAHSIKEGYFRFTQASELNDRFEGNWANNRKQVLKKTLSEYIQYLKNKKWENLFELSTDEIIALNSKTLPLEISPRIFPGLFTGSDEEKVTYKDKYLKDIEDIILENTENYCVFSTSAIFGSQLLWTHYANNEKGIVVSFNTDHAYFNDIRKVRYSKNRPNIKKLLSNWQYFSDFDKSEDICRWIFNSLFIKNKCWKYEKEYRLIKKAEEADEYKNRDSIYLFRIPFEAWDSIYYGSELDSSIEAILQKDFFAKRNKHHIKRIKVIKDIKKFSYQYISR